MKLNAETKARLVEGIKLGMTNKLAAQYAGVSESTFYAWRQRGQAGEPEFLELLESIKRAEAQSAAHCLAVIKKAAQEGNWTSAAWLLERRHGFRKEQVELTEPEVENTDHLVDPSTEEGREAIISHVAELPEDLILAALNRRAVAQ
jgi:transposase